MFIDERKWPGRLGKITVSSSIAVAAPAGCILMMTVLMHDTVARPGEAASLASLPTFHADAFLSDQRLALLLVFTGFLITTSGCFVFSRRAFRDALKAESRRTKGE